MEFSDNRGVWFVPSSIMFIACLEAGADFGGIVMSFENMPDSTDMEISAQSTTDENTPDTSPIAPMAAHCAEGR